MGLESKHSFGHKYTATRVSRDSRHENEGRTKAGIYSAGQPYPTGVTESDQRLR